MLFMEGTMDKDHVKKLLAGLCITSLISGATLLSGCSEKQATSS